MGSSWPQSRDTVPLTTCAVCVRLHDGGTAMFCNFKGCTLFPLVLILILFVIVVPVASRHHQTLSLWEIPMRRYTNFTLYFIFTNKFILKICFLKRKKEPVTNKYFSKINLVILASNNNNTKSLKSFWTIFRLTAHAQCRYCTVGTRRRGSRSTAWTRQIARRVTKQFLCQVIFLFNISGRKERNFVFVLKRTYCSVENVVQVMVGIWGAPWAST
jgi:hypothetical protein